MHPRWSSRTTPSTAASSRVCTSSEGWAAAGMAGSTEAHVGVIMHIAQPLVGRVPCAGSQQLSFAGLSPAIRDSAYVALGSAACVWGPSPMLAAPPEHLGAALQLRRVPAGSYPGLTLCPPSFLRYRASELHRFLRRSRGTPQGSGARYAHQPVSRSRPSLHAIRSARVGPQP